MTGGVGSGAVEENPRDEVRNKLGLGGRADDGCEDTEVTLVWNRKVGAEDMRNGNG